MTHSDISRRTVAKGAGWAVPAVAVSAAAPALAATPVPDIERSFYIRNTNTLYGGAPTTCSGSGSFRLGVETNDASYYYRITNVTDAKQVTNVQASILVEKRVVDLMTQPFTWTSATPAWSSPVRDTTQTFRDPATGRVYYRYFSSLLAPVPAPVGGVITLPRIRWYSTCHGALYTAQQSSGGVWINGRGVATVNGVQIEDIGGYRKTLTGG